MPSLFKMITYTGTIALILLVCGFILGIFDINFYAHKYTGMAIMAFALIHAGLVIYSRLK